MLLLVCVWVVAILCNAYAFRRYPYTSEWFPISVFDGPSFHTSGLPYAVLFVVLLLLALKFVARMGAFSVWLAALVLIVLGNLSQGSVEVAFYKPFIEEGHQYYSEALKIGDGSEWLRSFNSIQAGLTNHARTHPPFAVLIHLLFDWGSNKLLSLALTFTLLSSLTVVLVREIMKSVGLSATSSSLFALLLAVIPAFNIYGAVCLDGIIATSSTLFLLGAIRIYRRGVDPLGVVYFVFGMLISNLLSFGGVFLIATALLVGIRELVIERRYRILGALTATLLVGVVLFVAMQSVFNYNHLQAFVTASAIENWDGFMLLSDPIRYAMTRVECVSEIALFLSFGVLALLFHRAYIKTRLLGIEDGVNAFFLVGAATLLAMFLAGAFRTGETARACLYIYPYFLLAIRNVEVYTLRALVLAAGFQTIVMQLVGWYFW
jgi:hypothetical protein